MVKIYVQSQWGVVLLWYHRFWQSSVQRRRHTKLCTISFLKWIIQICSKFYCWVSKNCLLLFKSTLLFGETALLMEICATTLTLSRFLWFIHRTPVPEVRGPLQPDRVRSDLEDLAGKHFSAVQEAQEEIQRNHQHTQQPGGLHDRLPSLVMISTALFVT